MVSRYWIELSQLTALRENRWDHVWDHVSHSILDEDSSAIKLVVRKNSTAGSLNMERKKVIKKEDAFVLWDTYGFPLDLTQQGGAAIVMDFDATAALHQKGIPVTKDSVKFRWPENHESVIKAIFTGFEFVESADSGNEVGIFLESTSFYAEQGGQIFDNGYIEDPFGLFQVDYDIDRRKLFAANQTYTHMLNFGLRKLGRNQAHLYSARIFWTHLRIHIENTQEAKAFALLSEEGIAKGIRRITAVKADSAFKAMELACLHEQEVNDASKTERSLLEMKVASLHSRVDSAPIPAARKADSRSKIALLQMLRQG
ncbi:hypothetical protein FEM48_Zijuj07G0068500 [Ziziphus jujuba var. spinosa]|uniref:Alanine--tRNA ligase n=1 Tax=Ziziphus jujuba var. spinosa TaxID=714518 RepID=A0A978V346_ZIZJJ|nr:hypothetical protein FEM48_Zijuj07G0068500 [Ziziphus jujuba var. spinosa]